MYPLNEFVLWANVQTRRSHAMVVSPLLNVMVLACENNELGDIVQVYQSCKLSLCREFIVNHVYNSANLVFTADDNLLVMGNRREERGVVCLIDIHAQCEVGIVGNPDGYKQGACCNPTMPFYMAAGLGHIVVSYVAYGHLNIGAHEDGCMASLIRIFEGSHTAWNLHHVVDPENVDISMQVMPSTGFLAVLITLWAQCRRYDSVMPKDFGEYLCDDDAQQLVSVQEGVGRDCDGDGDGDLLILQESRVILMRKHAYKSFTHRDEGVLLLDKGPEQNTIPVACAWHPDGSLIVLCTELVTADLAYRPSYLTFLRPS